MSLPKKATANVVPGMRYHDAPAAIDFLCQAFGFEKGLVVPGEQAGTIAHAQLRFGNGMIMLGTAGAHGGDLDELMTTPRDTGGRNTQSAYVIVEDPKTHHDRAVASGAEIVLQLEDKDYGGSGYTCRDLEGHLWSFGDYDPFCRLTPRARPQVRSPSPLPASSPRSRRRSGGSGWWGCASRGPAG